MPKRALLLAHALAVTLVFPVGAPAQPADPIGAGEQPTPGQAVGVTGSQTSGVIVKYEEGVGPAEQAAVLRDEGLQKSRDLGIIGADAAEVEGGAVGGALRELANNPDVEYAEPDRLVRRFGYRDEPHFDQLWGLHNTGQGVPAGARPGTPNVDVNALQASAVTQGDEDVVVAVIDDGVDISHPDLADRAWENPGEVPGNGLDDDGNGHADDANGWDFRHGDGSVHDAGDDSHGTHVAGTIAASVNGEGVVGVAPNVEVMPVKFMGADGGTTSAAIKAIGYAEGEGATISNNSWGYEGRPSRALEEAIRESGMLFVAAAGNGGPDHEGDDNDADAKRAVYPASYDLPNVLSVAAANNRGRLAPFSNYGARSVDVAAPGVKVLSTVPDDGYAYASGTSMAAPHAAGTAALVASEFPRALDRPRALKKAITQNGKPLPSSKGKTVTGEMVDARAAVTNDGLER